MAKSNAIVVYVTAGSKAQAQDISRQLLEDKLAACVGTIGVESVFQWKGKIENAKEILLIIKTKKSLFRKLEKKVKSLHRYEVPEIIALPIISGHKPYLKWINDTTA